MKLDFNFENDSAQTVVIEVFNALNTFANVQNILYPPVTGNNFNYIPNATGNTTYDGTVFFNAAGELVINNNTSTARAAITCIQYPYRSLIEYLKTGNLRITNIRIKCLVNPAIITTPIIQIETDLDSSGQSIHNPNVNPLNKIPGLLDYKCDILITGKTGLTFELPPLGAVGALFWSLTCKQEN